MSRWLTRLSVAMVLAVSPAVAAPDFTALEIEPYDPPKPATAFALPDLTGKMVQLADLRGKVVLAFFWAAW